MHYGDIIMGTIASQITNLIIVCSTVYSGADQRKDQLRVTGLCEGNSPGTGEFPVQMASYAENVSIWWRHHDYWDIIGEPNNIITRPNLDEHWTRWWIIKHIHYKIWNEITYPFTYFNGATVEVCEWISNSIPHFTVHVITYPCWD